MEAQPPPLPVSVLPVQRWRLWLHLLLVVPYPLIAAFAGGADKESKRSALTGGWKSLLLVCGIELMVFSTVLGLAVWLSRTTRDDLMLRARGMGRFIVQGMGYSLAIRFGIGLIMGLVAAVLILLGVVTQEAIEQFVNSNRPDVEKLVDVKALKNDPIYFWLTLTFVSFVVAGLREELWRSASLTGLRKLWPQWFGSTKGQLIGVVLTSLLFGIGHLSQGWFAVGVTALIGMALGTIMVLHRSAWPAIIAHGAFDAASFALLPLVLK